MIERMSCFGMTDIQSLQSISLTQPKDENVDCGYSIHLSMILLLVVIQGKNMNTRTTMQFSECRFNPMSYPTRVNYWDLNSGKAEIWDQF